MVRRIERVMGAWSEGLRCRVGGVVVEVQASW
jgi:hypothetical protein